MTLGRLVSVQVGAIETFDYRGRKVRTGIFKRPVTGRVAVRTLGLEGDRQADPRFHGGPRKAVYLYPSEHYVFWREQLPAEMELPWGLFGENLTTEGFQEADLAAGMRLRIGSAVFEVTTPREPCFKLGSRLGDVRWIETFRESGRWGTYLAVVEEGEVGAGDPVMRIDNRT
jgi:MOSC domain-containing protein YiiM